MAMRDRGSSGPKRMTIADFLPTTSHPAPLNINSNTHTNTNTTTNNESNTQHVPYTVRATKKGGVPCTVETRKHHKVVVLTNIEGNVSALLSALQKSLGTGGVSKGTSIEIQGEHHLEKVKKLCLDSGCVLGASKQSKAEAVAMGKDSKRTKKGETASNGTTTTKSAIDVTVPLSQVEMKAMKPTLLKEHLAVRQLSTQGNKKELLARLMASGIK